MAKRDAKPLNMNIDADLLERIEKYRFKRMFASRSEAIEFLLEAGLKLNPERSKDAAKVTRNKGE
jgi:metal-responsive CopG/Arc/MetJ family transcriptional regulator